MQEMAAMCDIVRREMPGDDLPVFFTDKGCPCLPKAQSPRTQGEYWGLEAPEPTVECFLGVRGSHSFWGGAKGSVLRMQHPHSPLLEATL